MNVAEYCRLYIQDEWNRLSPSTRKSYLEALTSFTIHCTRRGADAPDSRSWLNGEPAAPSKRIDSHDEIMVLPPVSGG